MKVKSSDLVLLLSPDNKTFLVKATPEKHFHTHLGIVNLDDVIDKNFGEIVISSLDNSFIILEPTIEDKMRKVKRLTQIIYPKDAALIVLKSGILPGMKVVECGVGSGALTIVLANAVAPDGKVYAYDRREDFLKNAESNVKEAGFGEYVEYKLRDSKDGFDEQNVDVVVLDLPSPWDGIPAAANVLRGGGRVVSLSPTINQVEKASNCFKEEGFVFLETFEVLLRNYLVRDGKTRPMDRMIAHTGYLTVGRKASRENKIINS